MVTNEQKWAELIGKFLSGDISDEEQSLLDTWRRKSNEHEEFYKEMTSVWQITEPPSPALSSNIEEKWNALSKRIGSDDQGKLTRVRTLYSWVAAAAAIVLLAIIFMPDGFQPLRGHTAPVIASADAGSAVKEVVLPDGSRVWVRPGSSISYDPQFRVRNIILSGEAFFDVESNPSSPFTVTVGEATATVLGTRFNLRALENGTVELAVEEGRVEFGSAAQVSEKVVVGQAEAYAVRPATQEIIRLPGISQNILSWRSGMLSFEDAPFSNVIRDLENHYSVRFQVTDSTLLGCVLTTEFNDRPLEEVLSTLEFMMNWEINPTSEGAYSINGQPCNQK